MQWDCFSRQVLSAHDGGGTRTPTSQASLPGNLVLLPGRLCCSVRHLEAGEEGKGCRAGQGRWHTPCHLPSCPPRSLLLCSHSDPLIPPPWRHLHCRHLACFPFALEPGPEHLELFSPHLLCPFPSSSSFGELKIQKVKPGCLLSIECKKKKKKWFWNEITSNKESQLLTTSPKSPLENYHKYLHLLSCFTLIKLAFFPRSRILTQELFLVLRVCFCFH